MFLISSKFQLKNDKATAAHFAREKRIPQLEMPSNDLAIKTWHKFTQFRHEEERRITKKKSYYYRRLLFMSLQRFVTSFSFEVMLYLVPVFRNPDGRYRGRGWNRNV
jgi:hypothetical protein